MSIEFARWISRKDIRRIEQDNKDSAYFGISLLANADAEVAYVDRADLEAEEPVFLWKAPELPDTALPIIRVEMLSYRYEKLGTQILSKLGRYFEQRDTRFYAADLDDEGNVVVVGCWNYDRKTKEYVGQGGAIPHHDAHGNALNAAVSKCISDVVKRLNANKPPQDQRRATWNDINDITTYGRFKIQQAADRGVSLTFVEKSK